MQDLGFPTPEKLLEYAVAKVRPISNLIVVFNKDRYYGLGFDKDCNYLLISSEKNPPSKSHSEDDIIYLAKPFASLNSCPTSNMQFFNIVISPSKEVFLSENNSFLGLEAIVHELLENIVITRDNLDLANNYVFSATLRNIFENPSVEKINITTREIVLYGGETISLEI